mmetsp:Transcript_25881/g.31305  ORF Transcript_25881/g.31305 Transcript_25881/m.31305 type:complete len:106 (-) Transcript_25881:43-360(-)
MLLLSLKLQSTFLSDPDPNYFSDNVMSGYSRVCVSQSNGLDCHPKRSSDNVIRSNIMPRSLEIRVAEHDRGQYNAGCICFNVLDVVLLRLWDVFERKQTRELRKV